MSNPDAKLLKLEFALAFIESTQYAEEGKCMMEIEYDLEQAK